MLIGRSAEAERVQRLLDAARRGHSDTLVLHGEPGVGKSALLRFAVEQSTGLTVLEARGFESESELPFAGLHELVRPLLDRLDALPGPQAAALRGALALAPPERTGGRFAAYAAVLGLLGAAAQVGPLLCVVDDAHWLDHESAEALVFAARRLEADAVAILFAARTGEGTFEASGLEHVTLEPLPPEAAVELLATGSHSAVAPEVAARVARETGGNPLALLETTRALTAGQLSGQEALADPLPVGRSAERLFSRRIEALSPAGRQALLVATAAEDEDLGVVLAAARSLGIDAGGLEEAEAAGLVAVSAGRLSFCHPLARSAIYAGARAADRRHAHRALADVVPEPKRAWQLALSAFGPDEAVAQALEEAAMAAHRRTGYASAAAALDRAARLSQDPAAQARRLFLAADAARLAGQGRRSVGLLEAAADCAQDESQRAAIDHARGRIELLHGRTDAAQAILIAAADEVQERDPGQATTMLAEAAFAAMIGGDGEAAVRIGRRAQGLEHASGGLVELVTGLVGGTALFRAGHVAEGLQLVGDAAQLAEDAMEEGLEPEYAVHAAHVLSWVGEYRRARSLLGRIIREVRASGALGVLPWALYVSADLDTRTARWSVARADASEAARIADDTGNTLWRAYALSCLAVLDAVQGHDEECRAGAAEADAIARRLGVERPRKVADALGLLELGAGRPEQAIAHFEAAGDTRTRLVVADLLEAYIRAQRPVPEALGEFLGQIDGSTPAGRALVQRCRGLLASDDDFERCFAAALEGYDAAGMPFGRARTALLFGERLRRAGRRIESRGHLRAALETFTRLDAAAWMQRAEQELRATGETVPNLGPDARDRLTPQELQVALVVAQGATTREAGASLFLSPKTIEYHLGHVYRKLGVRSRIELALRLGDAVEAPTALA